MVNIGSHMSYRGRVYKTIEIFNNQHWVSVITCSLYCYEVYDTDYLDYSKCTLLHGLCVCTGK